MKIVIPGNPIADVRPRHKNIGNVTMTYDPLSKEKERVKKMILFEVNKTLNSDCKEIVMEASNLAQDCAFSVDLCFHLPIPKSSSNSKKKAMHQGFIKMTKKPDIDNLCKFILDCANGILFPDDRMITTLIARKWYSENPRTEILILSNHQQGVPT